LSDGSIGYACEEKRSPQKCPDRMRVYEDGTNKVTREHNHDPSGVKTKRLKVSKKICSVLNGTSMEASTETNKQINYQHPT
jgi:hypothetical protein